MPQTAQTPTFSRGENEAGTIINTLSKKATLYCDAGGASTVPGNQ
ncbi:hypothetical protein KUC_3602 [Vreelandella boliviensis LC1]|uniref:Uncharacterized protein n=1 Tax=Vreelandella boliviensis LC1 TaxID=1072583 RepID=A0A7U9BXS7_9GAMM|nr:hypothetical protein KUC_3602 [Halomonas boliviensis LC1]